MQWLTGQRRDLLFCFSFLLEMPITEYSEHRGTGGVMAEGSAIGCYQQNWVLEGKNTGGGEHTKLKPEREKSYCKLCVHMCGGKLGQAAGSTAKLFLKYSKFSLRKQSFPSGLMN